MLVVEDIVDTGHTLAYLLSWIVLAMLWRGKEVNFRGVFMLALVLLAFGFALTFPPIFLIFAAE